MPSDTGFDFLLALGKSEYALSRANRRARSAAGALRVIDRRVIVVYRDRALGALFLADLAADTAVLANILRDLSGVFGRAANVDLLLCGVDNDKVVRTHGNALSARNALLRIDYRNAVDYRDRVFGADRGAVAVAVTARSAVAFSVVEAQDGVPINV